MDKQQAKKVLLEEGRFVIPVERAENISKAFELVLDKSIIRTGSFGYRETGNENVARVNVSSLSENICKRLKKQPDEKTLKCANSMFGEGSYRDLFSKAYAVNL